MRSTVLPAEKGEKEFQAKVLLGMKNTVQRILLNLLFTKKALLRLPVFLPQSRYGFVACTAWREWSWTAERKRAEKTTRHRNDRPRRR